MNLVMLGLWQKHGRLKWNHLNVELRLNSDGNVITELPYKCLNLHNNITNQKVKKNTVSVKKKKNCKISWHEAIICDPKLKYVIILITKLSMSFINDFLNLIDFLRTNISCGDETFELQQFLSFHFNCFFFKVQIKLKWILLLKS